MPSTLVAYLIMEVGFSYALATFAVNFALSMIVARVFSSSAGNQNTDNGVRQQVPPATTNSLPIVYGDAYLGGVFVDAVLSIDQKTMYYVLAISQISPNGQFTIDAPGASTSAGSFVTGNSYTIQFIGTTDFTLIGASANTIGVTFTATGPGTGTGIAGPNAQMYWQDQYMAFDATDRTKVISLTDGSGNVQTKVSGNLYINLYTSNEAGTITPLNGSAAPSSVMGGSDIATAQQWPSSGRQMNGLAFAIVKMVYSQDAGTTQMQAITFHAHHYLNSTGVAKPGDVWYDYITNVKYGCGMGASIVDAATATLLNTYSDQTITYTPSGGGSATQPRYRINGVLDTGQNVLSNLDQIMLSCDSWNQYNAATGKWSVVINQARSTDFAFDDTNIVGEIRVSAYDISQSINQVEAQFPNKLNRDQAAYVYLNTPSNLLFSNEPLNKYSLTYSLVNESVQTQYLANRLLEQAREDLIVSFATTYNGIQVDAGDVISVTNSAYGWSAKLFRVIKVSEVSLPDGNLGAALELNEYNVNVYADTSITAFSASPNSNLPSATYFSPLSTPTISTSNPSSAIPNFSITVSVPAIGRVTYIDLYYTTVSSPSPSDWKLLSSASATNGQAFTPSGSYIFENQVLPTGGSSTIVYYFGYVVSSDLSKSSISPISSSFTWSPVAPVGPSGTNGLNFLNAYLVQSQSASIPTFSTPTSGNAIPSGWTATAPSVSVGQVMWYIQGQYNSSAVTINGVSPNTTAWTGPIAASIFQDIRSDNWNGSNPPSASTISTWGTTGYYISRNDGNMYANGFYARGVMVVNGSVYNPSFAVTTALNANQSGTSTDGITGYTNASIGHGVVGWTDNSGASAGVDGVSTVNGPYGVQAANLAGGFGLNVVGKMQISNSTLVTNLNADYVNGLHYAGVATPSTGTATFATTTKPSNTTTTNNWLQVIIAGVVYYIPAWQ